MLTTRAVTVPGARFNELYNWDSYFMALGLLVDGQVSLAKGMVDHFVFEIRHYNKILNGNRSYVSSTSNLRAVLLLTRFLQYLCRSQPPFLTDMALQIYNQLPRTDMNANNAWLKRAIQAAVKEYHTVWMSRPRFDPETGLSRFRPGGLGIPVRICVRIEYCCADVDMYSPRPRPRTSRISCSRSQTSTDCRSWSSARSITMAS